jgi:hypothetical protein
LFIFFVLHRLWINAITFLTFVAPTLSSRNREIPPRQSFKAVKIATAYSPFAPSCVGTRERFAALLSKTGKSLPQAFFVLIF